MAQQAGPGAKRGEERTFKILEGEMKFCWCPKGEFVIGSPRDEAEHNFDEVQVAVDLTHGFWIGKFEVTQQQWDDVMKASVTNPSHFKGKTLPVEQVSWHQATLFCERLTKAARDLGQLPQGWEYRLPTEAQWEYACRASAETAYAFGDDPQLLGDYGWTRENSEQSTHPVGEKKSNAWGLCDMHGNVYEWCRDGYHVKLPAGIDPEAIDGRKRVLRGGSWGSPGNRARSAGRSSADPGVRHSRIGFRCVRIPSSP